jgi:DNA repair photolyase
MNPPLIISASRRTDIPAFYSEWFMQRIRAGSAKVHHPFTRQEISVSLKPEDVAAVVFWTKNFEPMLKHLDELEERGFNCLVHYTITGLGKNFEPNVPEPERSVETLKKLSERIGPERVLWRFDPIILTEKIGEAETISRFEKLSAQLAGHTRRVYFSFVELYARVLRRIKIYESESKDRVLEPELETKQRISQTLAELARAKGMSIYACCQPDLVGFGIEQASCMDARLIAKLAGKNFELKPSPTRKGCGCYYSLDIGAYDSCPHLCWYCYANSHPALVKKRRASHRPESEFLVK